MEKIPEDIATITRRCLYEVYTSFQEEHPDIDREKLLNFVYESMMDTAAIEMETYYEQVGTLVFDYYVKYKNFIDDNDLIELIEEMRDLEEISNFFLDPENGKMYFLLLLDEIIDDYEDPYSFEFFNDVYQQNPSLITDIAQIYHPEPEVFFDSFKAYQDRNQKIEAFNDLDTPDLASLFLSYHVLSFALQDEVDALDQLYFKFDGYKDGNPSLRTDLLTHLIPLYYSIVKNQEFLNVPVTSLDLDLLSLCEMKSKEEIFAFLEVDENMPYVNQMLKTAVLHYEGKELASSANSSVTSYVKTMQQKMKGEY